MAKILVVDDDRRYGDVLRRLFELRGHNTQLALNGRTCLEWARAYDPDIIILDLDLPDLTGHQLLYRLRVDGCNASVIVHTGYDDEVVRIESFRLGADLFLGKMVRSEEIVVCVEALIRRRTPSRDVETRRPVSDVEQFGDVLVDIGTRSVCRRREEIPLRPMEFSLLLALLHRGGDVASRLQLLEEVWGHRAAVMTRTVDTHVAALRRKLEDQPSKPKYILTIPKVGYRLRRDLVPPGSAAFGVTPVIDSK
jgi:DNA-binding response OmpR family regulator